MNGLNRLTCCFTMLYLLAPSKNMKKISLKYFFFLFLGKFYNYDSYCSMYEDVFEWILEAFDELNAMDDLADDLETIKFQVR